MMSAIESISGLNARLTANGRRNWRRMLAVPNLGAYAAGVVVKLKALAPYALIELVLPGGSVLALLLWLYRRQRRIPVFATHEILALL
jgi:hypothetical protein